ncbi:hypothetical protein CPLU01_11814 [Colletotrichum plurivorum]|uniref:Uncharacterized protein n=1 Tax=Colletotrichum plurivorum TaxID=2175906 RepID=A0A8H6K0D0_9PEZI|nr:hypothetical protein CPLU01_11814 [Colletotrichum plurivorum]
MCQTLVPQSTCRQCGVPVTFEGLPDPCNIVREGGVPFGACGNHSVRTILGPSLCNNCRYQLDDDVAMGNTGGLLATESAPIPFLPPLPVIQPSSYSAGPAVLSPRPRPAYDLPPPPGLNPPRARRQSFSPGQIYEDSPRPMSEVSNYGATARPMSEVVNYGAAVRPPTPYRPLGRRGSRRGQPSLREQYGIADPTPQVRTPGAVSRGGLTFVGGGHPIAPRSRTRQPTPYVTRAQDADEDMLEYDENEDYEEYEEEEEEEDESSDSSGGAALPSRPSAGSPWSTSQPSSSRPMPLPGVSPIFSGFGHTQPRAPPPNTPAYGDLLPELPSPTDGPEAWIPPSWPAPGPLPAEAAEALARHTANSHFRGHRVYFVTSAGDEVDTVLVTTPDRRRMRVLSAELYRATAHEVNERETALREALERALVEQQAEASRAAREERRRLRNGACIHFPCRDAGCDRAHEKDQRRPLTPSNLAPFFQANLRVRDYEPSARGRVPFRSAARVGGSGLRRVEFVEGDDVFGDGEVGELVEEEEESWEDEEEEENKENSSPQDANPTTPPRVSLQLTVEDDTPSPLDLNGPTNHSTNANSRTSPTVSLQPTVEDDTPSPLDLNGTTNQSNAAPQQLTEKNGEQETHSTIHLSDAGSRIPGPSRAPRQQVRNRPFRDETRTSTGSPPPRSSRAYIPVRSNATAQASWRARSEVVPGAGSSGGAGGPSSQKATARQKGKGKEKETPGEGSSSSAQKLLNDDGPGLGDLVIPPKEEDDIQ